MSEQNETEVTGTTQTALISPTIITGVAELLQNMTGLLTTFFQLYMQFYMLKMMLELLKDFFTTLIPKG